MDVRQTLRTIEQELNQVHFERQEVIRGLLVAVLARQHVILLGPPGTGKSRLARDLCQRVQGRFFEWQLTRMSTPEELFGPISLQGLQQDRYRRIPAGKLPEADIAYLDETFKASSAILNTLLAAMNERVFFNDGQAVPMPLQMLIGASNELPEDREELGALWDRFLLRYVVDYVRTPAAFQALLGVPVTPPVTTTIPLAALTQAQAAVAQVDPSPVLGLLATLRQELAKAGLVASDRRWRQSLGLIQAQAWLAGRTAADASDVTILQHVLWAEPDQRIAVAKAVLMLVSPFDQEAQDILDDAQDAYLAALSAPADENKATVGLNASNAIQAAVKRMEALLAKAQTAGQPARRAQEGLAQLQDWNEEILRACLGVRIPTR